MAWTYRHRRHAPTSALVPSQASPRGGLNGGGEGGNRRPANGRAGNILIYVALKMKRYSFLVAQTFRYEEAVRRFWAAAGTFIVVNR